MEFKIGDVVMLKSGGSLMTVVEINATAIRQKACHYGGTLPSHFPGLEYESVTDLIRCMWNDHCGHGEIVVPVAALRMKGVIKPMDSLVAAGDGLPIRETSSAPS